MRRIGSPNSWLNIPKVLPSLVLFLTSLDGGVGVDEFVEESTWTCFSCPSVVPTITTATTIKMHRICWEKSWFSWNSKILGIMFRWRVYWSWVLFEIKLYGYLLVSSHFCQYWFNNLSTVKCFLEYILSVSTRLAFGLELNVNFRSEHSLNTRTWHMYYDP